MKYLLSFILLISLNANASFLIEPFAGMNFNGQFQADGATDKDNFSGTMYGGRAGVEKMGFMIGMDARISNWEIDDNNNSELSTTSYGFFAGYNFPMLLRVWGTYVFGGDGTVKDSGDFLKGSGFILGIGYKVFPFISLNFESGNLKFSEFETEAGVNDSGRSDEATYYLLSVSIPLNIGL